MAKIDWQLGDTVRPEDLNLMGQEINDNAEVIAGHKSAAVLDHPDGSVTTEKLADGAVTAAKVAADVAKTADLASHLNATNGVHGATSAATANRIIQRDSAGRAKVAAPAAADDIARKDTVDAVQANLTNHIADYVRQPGYAAASGSANTYAVSLSPAPTAYVEGMAIAVKINVNNTGASTINVNGLGAKAIKKPNGNDVSAGNLKAGSIYTLRYNGTNFILQGEGGAGTAQPANVLSGMTFMNDIGEQVGTMPNRGNINQTLTNQGQVYTIPAGYHEGSGKVTANITNLSAGNIKAGATVGGVAGTFSSDGNATAAQILTGRIAYVNGAKVTGTMPNRTGHVTGQSVSRSGTTIRIRPQAGYYPGDSGNSVQISDSNFIAANIVSGKTIFGLAGTFSVITTINYPPWTWGPYEYTYFPGGGYVANPTMDLNTPLNNCKGLRVYFLVTEGTGWLGPYNVRYHDGTQWNTVGQINVETLNTQFFWEGTFDREVRITRIHIQPTRYSSTNTLFYSDIIFIKRYNV